MTLIEGGREYVWTADGERVLWRRSLAGVRLRPQTGTRLREGRPEVRDPGPRKGQALPRLRGDTGPRGTLPRVLFSESRLGLSHAADARGHGLRNRHAAGRQEGLRDHRRRT